MKRIGIDTETWLINSEQGIVAPRMVCLTFCTEDAEVGLLGREDALSFMHALLDADDIVFVAHHARFDFAVLAAADASLLPKIFRAYDEGRVRCTMVREKLLALARGELADEGDTGAKRNVKFSLAACVERRFSIDLSEAKVAKGGVKPWRLRFSELDGIPVEQWPADARDYALDDAKWNLALFDAQTQELNDQDMRGDMIPDEAYQTRGAFWLYLLSVRGVRTDVVRVNHLKDTLEAEYARINAIVRAADVLKPKMQKGEMVWSKNMAALRERVVLAYGGEDYAPKTEKGAISTARDDLLKPANKQVLDWIEKAETEILQARKADGLSLMTGDETAALTRDLAFAAGEQFNVGGEQVYNWLVLHAVGERSGVEKLLNTYVPTLLQGTQFPITTSYTELLASGRTSSVKPNLQNPPRKGGIRECFIPRPGYYYAFCDYSFIELCTLAQSCVEMFGWSEMADAINAGLDPHLDMAATMLGIDYAEALARKKIKDTEIAEYRQLSKCLNFGYPGGLGAAKFVDYARAGYGVILTESDARRRKEEWYKKWPEMRLYHQHFGNMTLGDRKFTLVQPGSNRVRGQVGFCDGANCVDYETEALTQRGWVRGDDLRLDDFVLTKNAETGELEWQQPDAVFHYPDYDGPLVEFESTRFSAVTTPEHRWLVNRKRGGTACLRTHELSRYGDDRIHRTGNYVGEDAAYDDAFLELVGWFLTDGSMDTEDGATRIRIYQTKADTSAKIDDMFARLGIPVSRSAPASRTVGDKVSRVWSFSDVATYRTGLAKSVASSANPVGVNRGYTVDDYLAAGMGVDPDALVASRLGVTLAAVGSRRRAQGMPRPVQARHGLASRLRNLFPQRVLTPQFVAELSGRQARLLLDTMMLGDGTRSAKGQEHFYTRDESASDAFQMLLVLAGQASKAAWTNLSERVIPKYDSMPNSPKAKGIWTVDLYKRDTVQVLKHQVREFTEARGVWCPSVPNTYFVARRNKTVYITGNSVFQGRAADGAKRAGWYIAKECYLDDPYRDGSGPTPLYGARPVLFVHDEFILEVPVATAHEATMRLSAVMIAGMREVVPDVKVGTEYAVATRWYKGAEAAYDESKRLVPWEPKKK